ncbi:MAG: penicillin acylase family protein, partial [Flavisolibacter sp.]
YGAENTLKQVAKDQFSQKVYNAYTAGVNAYINSLTESTLPVEYKLLDHRPEPWTNLKIALFIKLMSSDLAGQHYAKDIAFTNEKSVFSKEEIDLLYPQVSDSSMPIIPKGTGFANPGINPVPPANVDSFYNRKDTTINPVQVPKPVEIKGSNNWAVSGIKTKSGAPILCNDPHLRLTLPSIWFEMQIQTPTMNAYGATFPSIPGVVIGFNDNIAFGFTNAGRDVIDYYQIRFKDDSRKEYWYNNEWVPATQRIEQIVVRGAKTINDTVSYTVFGPVVYDRSFTAEDSNTKTALAMRWVAHDPSNEVLTWIKLNRAKNYADYEDAIKYFDCPGQNMLFASKSGDIAIRQQGKFPARWKDQGLYLMPGETDDYAWQGFIPQQENPHVMNPIDGFIASANQRAVDSSYPYFIPGDYYVPRGRTLNRRLSQMTNITPQDMMKLQSDSYSSLAADAVPLFLKYTNETDLDGTEKQYLEEIKKWNFIYTADSKAPTTFQLWMDEMQNAIWSDEFSRLKGPVEFPDEQTTVELLLRDSALRYIDNIGTPAKEDLYQQVTSSFKNAVDTLEKNPERATWWKYKHTSIMHLLRESVKPFGRFNLMTGGWKTAVNALSQTNGPSWRMIVHLTPETEAYGVYPGGQSGNPGSKYYENFIDTWANGKYYKLWMMKQTEATDKRIIGKIIFTNA